MFFPAATIYSIWWIFFVIFMIICGRFYGCPMTCYDTNYHYNMRKTAAMAKTVGFKKENP